MIILSWNIQKITEEKAAQFAPVIGQMINEVTGGKPFVLVVYENKTKPEAVLSAIGSGIHASGLTMSYTPVGGGRSVQENILLIAGNGAAVDGPTAFTDWRNDFDSKCRQLHQAEIVSARSGVARLEGSRPARESIQRGRELLVARAEEGTFLPAEHFRDPVMLTARAGSESVSFLALHAPGPGAGQEHEEPFARTYAEAVMANAGGFDMVLGDFNLRTHEISADGFVDQSVRLGATTKGSEEGRHTYSRLDRVYARRGLDVNTALVSDGQERTLTDHHCLAVNVESPRSQPLLTSFFPYEPSPLRQQAVVYENYHLALASRVDNLQPDVPSAAASADVDMG